MPDDWADLAADVRACSRCPELAATRTTVVVGDAPAGARLLLLGEAPGADEDATGRPFVGRAGQLLDRLLADAGGDRAAVAVLNTLKCRPPLNRRPSRQELENCRPWTEQLLGLAAPSVVVTLGTTATAWALGAGFGTLASVRGRVHEAQGVRVVPTYHPSAALRWGPAGEPVRLLREDLAYALAVAQGQAA